MRPAEARIAEVIGTTEQLIVMVDEESELLTERRTQEIGARHEEKARLVELYGSELEALRADPSWRQAAAPGEVDRLAAATRRFHEVLDRHRRLVVAAKSVTERIFRAIGEEVARRQRPINGYDSGAALRTVPNVDRMPAAAIAVNQLV